MTPKLKILFIAQFYLKRELGGPKVVIELAEAINKIGHKADVVGIQEVEDYLKENSLNINKTYALNIKTYLERKSNDYDVVDVDANNLYEYKKNPNVSKPLIVARSVLFIPHLNEINWQYKISNFRKIKDYIKKILYGDLQKKSINNFYKSLDIADLINVSNHKDVEHLIANNYSQKKIINLPYGINDHKRNNMTNISISRSGNKIVFLGTYDFRKGCFDIPKIFAQINKNLPDADLTLLGVKGLFKNERQIISFFPKNLRNSITIIPEFKESELPHLLKDFKIGIFPSYLEGCPFSVIELIAAGIPVIAYNSPGPSSILPNEFLVAPGDWEEMADKVSFYLKDSEFYEVAKDKLIERSKCFSWDKIARDTVEAYINKLNRN